MPILRESTISHSHHETATFFICLKITEERKNVVSPFNDHVNFYFINL